MRLQVSVIDVHLGTAHAEDVIHQSDDALHVPEGHQALCARFCELGADFLGLLFVLLSLPGRGSSLPARYKQTACIPGRSDSTELGAGSAGCPVASAHGSSGPNRSASLNSLVNLVFS